MGYHFSTRTITSQMNKIEKKFMIKIICKQLKY